MGFRKLLANVETYLPSGFKKTFLVQTFNTFFSPGNFFLLLIISLPPAPPSFVPELLLLHVMPLRYVLQVSYLFSHDFILFRPSLHIEGFLPLDSLHHKLCSLQ